MKRFVPAVLLIALATACSSRRLAITLLTPAQTAPDAGALTALSFALVATWDGGLATAGAQTLGEGFSIDLPTGVPIALEIDGRQTGFPRWRGEWHGTIDPGSSSDSLGILMLPVGFVSSFPTLSGLPALAGASATPLDNGRVLILGGIVGAGLQQSAWIYDQRLVAFAPAAAPARPRAHHLALALEGGAVLVAGGDTEETSLEVYSPTDGGKLQGTLSAPQLLPSGAVLGGGVLVGCGWDPDGGTPTDTGADRWPDAGTLALACGGGQIVAGSGDALVISPAGAVRSVDASGSVTSLGGAITPRSRFGACPDGQGGVVVAGGFPSASAGGSGMRLIEEVAGATVKTQLLDTPRADTAVIAFDGGYLVVGGVDDNGTALASAQIIQAGSLMSGGELSLSQPRHFPAVAQIPGYRLILIVSGQGTNGEPSGGLDLFAAP